jgi:hypothetical protein
VYAGSATFAEGVKQDIFQTINDVTLSALSPLIISINRTPPIAFYEQSHLISIRHSTNSKDKTKN